jgi:putative Mn2+ efflux pump MntP
MIREALSKGEEGADASLALKAMLILAVATSIDALAIGITFAFLPVHIAAAVCLIGVTAFSLSIVGVKVGSVFGVQVQGKGGVLREEPVLFFSD